MSGKYPEATSAYREAIRIKPDYAEARTNLGSLLIAFNEYRRRSLNFRKPSG